MNDFGHLKRPDMADESHTTVMGMLLIIIALLVGVAVLMSQPRETNRATSNSITPQASQAKLTE